VLHALKLHISRVNKTAESGDMKTGKYNEKVNVYTRYLARRMNDIYDDNNSAVLVRERTIPTERQPLVGGVRANFCWVSRGQRGGSLWP
jgi:hypothetical protein